MPLHVEQLPSEIWLYIFTFLEGHDVVRAFSSLNSFSNFLLRSPHLQLHIRIKQNEAYERLPSLTWSHVNLQNIHSLSVGQRRANCLIQFLRWHAQHLIHLRSLAVYLTDINLYYKNQFLAFALQQMPSLNYLRIKHIGLHRRSFHFDPVFMYIFGHQSTITRCFLDFNWRNCDIETSTWFINSNLKYLRINEISWTKLFSILSFTPRLHYLKANMGPPNIISYESFILSDLRKVDLYLDSSPFTQLRIIKQVAPYMECLRLRGSSNANDDDYFNENAWKELFDNITYFDVTLTTWDYIVEQKLILSKRIRGCEQKEWFKWHEKNRCVIITFKSSII